MAEMKLLHNFISVCVCVCLHMCVWVCVCLCILVCIHEFMHVCVFTTNHSQAVNLIFLFTANNPPRITGPATLLVDLGVEARLVLNVSDDSNNFTVSILGGLPENSNLERTGPSEYIFTWMLNEIVNNTLEFEARDELNATAVHNVQVQICACENGGNCTINGIIGTAAGNILLNCECSEGSGFNGRSLSF